MRLCFSVSTRVEADFGLVYSLSMKSYTAVVEKCVDTGLYVGHVPGFPGAHSQGDSLDELNHNLKEVIEMLLEDGEPIFDSEFIGTQKVMVSINGQTSRSQT